MKKIIFLILLFACIYSISNAESKKEFFDSGVQYFKQGQYQKAIDSFSKLIEIDPDNADAYKNRGVTYMKLENFDQAIIDLEKAKELFPELKGLYSNLGVAWYYKKEYKKAILNYDTEIEMAPENAVVYFNRALCLTELGENEKALDDLSKTLELKPDFYWAICYKADILAGDGKDIDAIETYETAIQLAPENIYAIDKLAQLRKKIMNNNPEILTSKKSVDQPPPNNTIGNTVDTTIDLSLASTKTMNKPVAKYAIQVGAFLSEENAQRMKKRLVSNGFDCRILTLKDSKDKTWYVARSGNYPDKETAQGSRNLLKQQLNISSIIRPYGIW